MHFRPPPSCSAKDDPILWSLSQLSGLTQVLLVRLELGTDSNYISQSHTTQQLLIQPCLNLVSISSPSVPLTSSMIHFKVAVGLALSFHSVCRMVMIEPLATHIKDIFSALSLTCQKAEQA